MPGLDALFEQALLLPDDERGELAAKLLRTLDPNVEDELTRNEWEAAWSDEIDRRVREIRAGRVELIDGDEVLAELRAIVDRP